MAFIICNHKSNVLEKANEMRIILPDKKETDRLKVLYLLHGLSDDSSNWTRFSSIERYVRYNTDTIIVMPDGGRSFYTDMAYGGKYYTYITQELPDFIKATFKISDKREDTYIAGLSMGGYGAFKAALRNPRKYFAAASFSGALDIEELLNNNPDRKEEAIAILGASVAPDEDNLFCLLDENAANKPRLLQMCGTEDFLYNANIRFRDAAKEKKYDLEYIEKKGEHNWDFWDDCIKYALKYFDII